MFHRIFWTIVNKNRQGSSLFVPCGKLQSGQQATLVSQIEVYQGKEHIQLSHLFSSSLETGVAIVKQTFDNFENMLHLCSNR